MNCLRCNEPLHFVAHERLQLGQTGWILGDIPNLIAGSLKVGIYVCPTCHKLEFFAEEQEAQEGTLPQKTCPVCGTVHDFDYPQCPKCKHDYYAK